MKQTFSQKLHQRFKNHFNIKNSPSKFDEELFILTYKYIPYIKWIPGIKFIGVGNSTSMFIANENSDIDLFIITSPNRMWFVRILVTIIFQILGVRKTTEKHEKRFCLSFFTTTKGMNFKDFALKNDIYLYFRIVYLKPILDFDNIFEKFINSQSWANFEEYKNLIDENKKFIKFNGKSFADKCKILNLIEKNLEKIFLPYTLKRYQMLGKPYGIIINKKILKFHDNDKRIQIKKELLN